MKKDLFDAEIVSTHPSERQVALSTGRGDPTVWSIAPNMRGARELCKALRYRFRVDTNGRIASWTPLPFTSKDVERFSLYCGMSAASVRGVDPAAFESDPAGTLHARGGSEQALDRAKRYLPAAFSGVSGALFDLGANAAEINGIYLALQIRTATKRKPKPDEYLQWLSEHAYELIEDEDSASVRFEIFDSLMAITTIEDRVRSAALSRIVHDEHANHHTYWSWGWVKGQTAWLTGVPEDEVYKIIAAAVNDNSSRLRSFKLHEGPPKGNSKLTRTELNVWEGGAAAGISLFAERRVSYPLRAPSGLSADETVRALWGHMSRRPLTVLVGSAGTGKTYLAREIGRAMADSGKSVAWTATTGRASKVLHPEGKTLHSHLRVLPGVEKSVSDVPQVDLLIVDEASMLDTALARSLGAYLAGDNAPGRVLIVGDQYQVPSVGAGKVLHDLLASPVTSPSVFGLEVVRRTDSPEILSVANGIRNHTGLADFEDLSPTVTAIDDSDPRSVLEVVASLYREDSSCMFISPKYEGPLGVDALNKMLRDLHLGPSDAEWIPGQKVIQTKSHRYTLDENGEVVVDAGKSPKPAGGSSYTDTRVIANGTFGVVERADGSVHVDYEDEQSYDWSSTAAIPLAPAYALTVHRAQGSQADIVVVMASDSPRMWEDPALGYTAVTRAVKRLLIVGDPQRLLGDPTKGSHTRRTALVERMARKASARNGGAQ